MDQLIPVINKLLDVVAVVESSPIDLPQIVVVGSQSSGKSSVLEAICGRDFLPRGTGIVTRRPLILQLLNKKASSTGPKEWGEFLHIPGQKFDFNDISAEIKKETIRELGNNSNISSRPINLKIYSPSVLNLTLVDLPGLTKVAVGDQPKEISNLIREMVLSFIIKPTAVILAVSPANVDLANSDALNLAREVDPLGTRTIGVLTKLDLMDKGTDCLDVLQGRVYQLKLGFIAVVNRSQADINTNKSITAAREQERLFFANHSVYKQVVSRSGTEFLSKTLNKILMNHIRDTLPDLRMKVNATLSTARQEMAALGDSGISKSKGALLLQVINSFVSSFIGTIDGRLNSQQATEELYGGARINYIFNDVYGAYINSINNLANLTDEQIQVRISNATGTRSSLFIPEEAFEQLVKMQIKVLEEPSLRCVDFVFDELQRIVNLIEVTELKRFDSLREKIIDVVNNMLREFKRPTREMIQDLISMEIDYVNTNHPDFIGGGSAIAKIKARAQKQEGYAHNNNNPEAEEISQKSAQRQQQEAHQRATREAMEKQREEEERRARGEKTQENQGWSWNSWIGGNQKKDENPQQSRASQNDPGRQVQGNPNNSIPSTVSNNRQASVSQSPLPNNLQRVPVSVIPKNQVQRSENEDFQMELICELLESYFKIVKKTVKDRVPKTIMHFLVNKSKEDIQNVLVQELYKEDLLESLLQESDDIAQRREQYSQNIAILTSAQRILNEIIDFKL
jgi:dynamin 1-like protein